MEFINKILKRDASYASKYKVVDTSVTTPTTKLAMRANISKVGGIRVPDTKQSNDKSPSPRQFDCKEIDAGDIKLSLPLDDSKYGKLTPFEKPLFESAIMSGKTIKEALSFARKTLFMKMRERSSEKTTRNAASGNMKQPWSGDDNPQKVHPVRKQTSNVVGGTVHLSLVPFDVNKAPLSFTQMEQIQATIIDMMIEHNRREINAESLNCQFKTGWMAFKCSTATAEWLKLNCNDISKKCKVKLNVAEEINQNEKNFKQNETKSTQAPRLKRRYYLALNHLKNLKKAKESGEPLKNAKLLRVKYESMVEDYLETQNNGRRLRKLLILDGLLERPKKARPLHKRYRMALNCLDKLKKIEESGTPLDENKLMSRRRLQGVVDEYLREEANNKNSTDKNLNVRPFHEVITDPLCVAVGGKRKGLFVPIPNEWPAIQLQINELVTSYVLENQDGGPIPSYDINEVHRGFRVIKCMDEFSKRFLFKSLTSLRDKWKELNLMIIPASQIPKGRRDPIDLKAEAALKKINQTANIGSSSNSVENMDFQTPLKYNETKKTAALQDHDMVTSGPFRGLDFQTPQHHDLTEKTINENSARDLPLKQDLFQQPQTSRKAAGFSLQNRFNPLRSSDFKTHLHAVSTKIPEDFTENSRFGEEISPTSWQIKPNRFLESNGTSRRSRERDLTQNQAITKSEDWWNTSDITDNSGSNKIQFHQGYPPDYSKPYRNDRFPVSNETLRRSSEKSGAQSHILMNSEDWRKSPDFYANSGSNRTQFYQESRPDCSNPYNIDRLPIRSRERNPIQTHILNNSDDWRRSPDFHENSKSNVTKFYQDSPPQCNYAYRNDRLLESNEILMRSRERIPERNCQTSENFETRLKSADFYEYSNSPLGCNRSLYRNDRELSPNEISMCNRKRNPALLDSEVRRKSHDFYALTQSYEVFPPHYSNPNRNSPSSDSFNNRYHKPDSYRSNEFHYVSQHRESSPYHFPQPDSRNNNLYSREEKNYLPRNDDDIPPPPPRWS